MTPSRRRCPVQGCTHTRRAGEVMCLPCWRRVPPDRQEIVRATVTRLQDAGDGAPRVAAIAAYRTATEGAIAALNGDGHGKR